MDAWNKGHPMGQKRPFKLEEVWRIRTRLELEHNIAELALLNLAIDSKLRACDLLPLKVQDITSAGIINPRVRLSQRKTHREVQFEITPPTQHCLTSWLLEQRLSAEDYIFPSPRCAHQPMSYSYYRAIVKNWAHQLGQNSDLYGTHSLRRTKATLIYRRTKDIRAIQILLGHVKLDNTVRYLGVEIEDALRISEPIEM